MLRIISIRILLRLYLLHRTSIPMVMWHPVMMKCDPRGGRRDSDGGPLRQVRERQGCRTTVDAFAGPDRSVAWRAPTVAASVLTIRAATPPWTDVLTALGTVGVAAMSLVALLVTIILAARDRRSSERRLHEEREQSEARLKEARSAQILNEQRQFIVKILLIVNDLYREYIDSESSHKGAEVAARLSVYLNLLPGSMCTLIRYTVGHTFDDNAKMKAEKIATQHGASLTRDVSPVWVYEELAEDIRNVLTRTEIPGARSWL